MSFEILMIGLDTIATSIGLALRHAQGETTRMGFDPSKPQARLALEAGAVDKLASSPGRAAAHADLVLISLRPNEVRDYLQAIGPALKPEAVVLNLSHGKQASTAWAQEVLPNGTAFVGVTPIVGPHALLHERNRPLEAHEDLFAQGLLAISLPADAPERAVALCVNLAKLLEAEPFFLDSSEHDAAIAFVESLPSLISAAFMHAAAHSSGWREIQRLAGVAFADMLALNPPDSLSGFKSELELSRGHVAHKLGDFITELENLRQALMSGSPEALERYLAEAERQRSDWEKAREQADWAGREIPRPDSLSTGFLGNLFGFSPRDRPKPKS